MLAALSPLLAGCDEPSQAATRCAGHACRKSASSPSSRSRARWCANCRAASRRRAISEVRPRVSGIVVERMFHQGSEVKAGDPLYRIDPRPFEVEVQSSKAALAKAEAALRAGRAAGAAHRSADQPAAPRAEVENEKAIAAERQAAADVEGRKADLARAELNLDYATIRAPIDGVVGAALGQRGRAGRAERHRDARDHPAARSDLCRLHPVGRRNDPAAPRLRDRRSRTHRARCDQGAARARRRLALSDRRQTAVLRSQGRRQYRAGDAARRVRQSEARIAAGHVCPRPHRAGHRQRCDRRAAAGGAAQRRRRQRGVRRQGRRPRRACSRCAPARCRTASGW